MQTLHKVLWGLRLAMRVPVKNGPFLKVQVLLGTTVCKLSFGFLGSFLSSDYDGIEFCFGALPGSCYPGFLVLA